MPPVLANGRPAGGHTDALGSRAVIAVLAQHGPAAGPPRSRLLEGPRAGALPVRIRFVAAPRQAPV
jgi:hypothetical protein